MPTTSTIVTICADIATLLAGESALAAVTTVVSLKVATNRAADLPTVNKYPCFIIAPYGARKIPEGGGTNARRDVIYPVLIAAIANDSSNALSALDTPATWMDVITDLFDQDPKLAWPTAGCYQSRVEPMAFVDADALLKNSLTAAGLIVNAYRREVRGARS